LTKIVTTTSLNEAAGATLLDLAAYLAQSGRAYRSKGGELLLPEKTDFSIPKHAEIGMALITADLISLVQNGAPVAIPHRGPYLGAIDRLADMHDALALLPKVSSVVRGPAFKFSPDGRRLLPRAIGYDAEDRVLTVEPSLPTLPEPDPGFPFLHKLFSGLLFADPLYCANLYGYLLASFARTALDDYPVLLLDAEDKSSGKTKTATAIGELLMGETPEPIGYAGGEQDVETRLGKYCEKTGPNFILIDNVRPKRGQTKQIRASIIKILTNSRCPGIRTLYKTGAPLCDPIAVFTMNGARVERDLADSIVRVSLRRPFGAANHRMIDPNPAKWARAHRLAIMAEALAILRAVELPDLTQESALGTRFYDFERVAVAAAGAMGLVANYHPEMVQTADAVVTELYNLMMDEFQGTAPMPALVAKIMTSSRVTELRDMLSAEGRTDRGLAFFLHEWLETTLKGQKHQIDKKTFMVVVSHDSHLNQQVVSVQFIK
jgi:hypothetical protein